MSQGNQSFLRFSLEESVWFQKGQEVEELVSISLDPNISIQENDQYVTIRGSLDLTGEYKPQDKAEEADNQLDSINKWVQSVEAREGGICEFYHQFPVDITIPANRVRDLTEIDVIIETFDYVLPESSCLRLTAELNISGLYGDESELDKREEEVPELVQVEWDPSPETLQAAHRSAQPDDFEPFEVEARKEEKEETVIPVTINQKAAPEVSFAPFRSEQQQPEEVMFSADLVDNVVNLAEHQEESPESSSVIEQKPVKQKKSNKKSMSIAEFLARKEIEDDHAKLKVCIVQHGESISVIAERYEISSQQLLKVNNMELNQDVYEGQVLYIPRR